MIIATQLSFDCVATTTPVIGPWFLSGTVGVSRVGLCRVCPLILPADIVSLVVGQLLHCCVFDALQKATFQGLSQETLSLCIQSLIRASDIISKNQVLTSHYHCFYLAASTDHL